MKHISIPEPCSENWNEMTPTQKGAYCQKCALEVIDFTDKSSEEIRDVLKSEMGSRVCGHIRPSQLNKLNDDFHRWFEKNETSVQRIFIFSLLLGFGLALFSCSQEQEPVVKNMQDVSLDILEHPKMLDENDLTSDTAIVNDIEHLRPADIPMPGQMIEYDFPVEGELTEIEPYDGIEIIEVESTIDGGMRFSDEYIEHLAQPEEIKVVEPVEIEFSAIAFPNPTTSTSTLRVELPQDETFNVRIFSLAGQEVNNLGPQRMHKGTNDMSLNIESLPSGMYLIMLESKERTKSVRLKKL